MGILYCNVPALGTFPVRHIFTRTADVVLMTAKFTRYNFFTWLKLVASYTTCNSVHFSPLHPPEDSGCVI